MEEAKGKTKQTKNKTNKQKATKPKQNKQQVHLKRQKRNVSAGVSWKKLIKINLALRFAV